MAEEDDEQLVTKPFKFVTGEPCSLLWRKEMC